METITERNNRMMIARIDCNKIEKARLFPGKNGAKYLDIVLIETKPSQYGDYRDDQTHMIVQSVSKQERDKGINGPILGNASDMSKRRTNDRQPELPTVGAPTSPIDQDDVPF